MRIKPILAAVACLASALAANADLPFRQHRYDSFKVLEIDTASIVFFGNSITNMHPWGEAFGNPKVLNRGVSGAFSPELVENVGVIAHGQPAKLFVMIGTNDLAVDNLNDPDSVAANIERIIDVMQERSPRTEIYVQSILPSSAGKRTLAAQAKTNGLIKEVCARKGVTYVDLFDEFVPLVEDRLGSYDGLHLTASGYRVWCNRIAPMVGSQCVYDPDFVDISAGYDRNSYGMRASYFGMLPVASDDVLLIGDEMIHGCEWQEILHCDKIKNRGSGWGYNSMSIRELKPTIPAILAGCGNKQTPAKVFLYAGAVDARKKMSPDSIMDEYKKLVNEVRRYAPKTKLHAVSLVPMATNQAIDEEIVKPFNQMLSQWAAANGIEYVDIYSAMLDGDSVNPELVMGEYVSGLGYARISQALAPYLAEEGAVPTTDAQAKRLYFENK